MRWRPFDIVEGDFVSGLRTLCGAGDPTLRNGVATHVYSCSKSMVDTAFYNADGDFLIGTYILTYSTHIRPYLHMYLLHLHVYITMLRHTRPSVTIIILP